MNDDIASTLSAAYAAPEGELSAELSAQLRDISRRYPYFTAPVLALLRHTEAESPELPSLRRYIIVATPSERTLAFAAHGDEWRNFYPEAPTAPQPKTEDVIDVFLNTYGSCSPEEEALLERMIFNPTPDYAEILAREEQEDLPEAPAADADSQDARIAAFILSQHPAAGTPNPLAAPVEESSEPPRPVSKPSPDDTSLLSESLAQIFIKQHRYERAYEIISGLYLKFPKKSAYFADQLRFLQKLIINQRCAERRKGTAAKL